MKQIKTIYTLLLAVAFTLLTACTVGDETTENGTKQKDGKVTVRFRVSQAAPATTRAAEEWEDKDNADDKEMMNIWTVVAVNNTSKNVEGIWSCKPSGKPDQEVDEINEIKAKLNENTSYRFYSFANMSPAKVMELLNIGSPSTATEGTILASEITGVGNNTIQEIAFNPVTVNADAESNNIPVKVEGNGFNKFTSADITEKDNGFGYYGIPMSNVQTFNSLKDGDIKDLIVIRMLAKIKLQIYNDSGENITINSVTLTSLTANTKEGDTDYKNLMLLPNLTKGQDTMESNAGYHGDIEPNLNGTPEQEVYIYTPENKSIDKNENTFANGKPVEYIFYVNESENPKGENWGKKDDDGTTQEFNRYFLKIDIEGEEEQRYTLIDDSNADNGNDKWNYIARNDYRIIPIVLDDYKLDMIPYDFPAIGVYPASVKEEDGIYSITFHDYGHFHLVPQVTKYSDTDTQKTLLPYGKSNEEGDQTYWTLYDNDFSTAWRTWADAKKTAYNGDFYKISDDTDDADDAGGQPVWYDNGATITPWNKPQWSPTGGAPYEPFIFGYIADPGESIKAGDKKVYHEFSINLYKQGTGAARQMTYRLYMILDQEQMLYRSRSLAAPAPRCPHHWH